MVNPRFPGFYDLLWSVISAFVGFVFFGIVLALLFLLVRFLLVGTRAAQLYVAKSEPPRPPRSSPVPPHAKPEPESHEDREPLADASSTVSPPENAAASGTQAPTTEPGAKPAAVPLGSEVGPDDSTRAFPVDPATPANEAAVNPADVTPTEKLPSTKPSARKAPSTRKPPPPPARRE